MYFNYVPLGSISRSGVKIVMGLIMLSGVPSKVLFTTMMSEQMPLVAVGEAKLRGCQNGIEL